MANTYILIASSTVGSGGAASIQFSSIPSTYTDLLVKITGRTSGAVDGSGIYFQVNGVTGSGKYSSKLLYGDGSTAASGSDLNGTTMIQFGQTNGASSTSNTFGSHEVYIPNYAATGNYKSISFDSVYENTNPNPYMMLTAGLYNENTAISTITFTAGANFVQYSTAYLYGISNS